MATKKNPVPSPAIETQAETFDPFEAPPRNEAPRRFALGPVGANGERRTGVVSKLLTQHPTPCLTYLAATGAFEAGIIIQPPPVGFTGSRLNCGEAPGWVNYTVVHSDALPLPRLYCAVARGRDRLHLVEVSSEDTAEEALSDARGLFVLITGALPSHKIGLITSAGTAKESVTSHWVSWGSKAGSIDVLLYVPKGYSLSTSLGEYLWPNMLENAEVPDCERAYPVSPES